ncbi:hypothetical protein HDR63_01455 [bacterium]|nr:hypothetical protein [bacterium]
MMTSIGIYALVIGLGAAIVYIYVYGLEYIISVRRRCYPMVPSIRHLRRAVIREIQTHYPDLRTAVEIGSGYGGLARKIARRCNMHVDALENMPVSALISRVGDLFCRGRCRTHWVDAFKYLARCAPVDVAVTYLGPNAHDQVAAYGDKFRVLITMDIPVTNRTPVRVVDVGHGYTRYGNHGFRVPHRLFIYEFKK